MQGITVVSGITKKDGAFGHGGGGGLSRDI